MTYEKAQALYRERHGRTVKSCWIADVKNKCDSPTRKAPNRRGPEPKHPCPDRIFVKLEKILRELDMFKNRKRM